MADEEIADDHLRAAYGGLVDALYLTKQGVWAAGSSERRQALKDLLEFFIEQSQRVDEAEAAIGGRSPEMAAPSAHERRNLLGEFGNDLDAARAAYVEHLNALAADLDRRAGDLDDHPAGRLLGDVAEQLRAQLVALAQVP